MKYYILLMIPVPETKFFMEVGLDYELPVHPNLTDEIICAGFPCKITRIYYDLDNLDDITLKIEAIDNLYMVDKNRSPEKCHELMQREWNELKSWCDSNEDRLILNDYYMDPRKDYESKIEIQIDIDKIQRAVDLVLNKDLI